MRHSEPKHPDPEMMDPNLFITTTDPQPIMASNAGYWKDFRVVSNFKDANKSF